MTFEELGAKFVALVDQGELSADRFEGPWKVRGGTPEQREQFKKLCAEGAKMVGFVGNDEDAQNYWLNRVKAHRQQRERTQ